MSLTRRNFLQLGLALNALYPTCAVPGCSVPFARCKLHHVTAWEDGGPTDLDNLLPVCVRHHHAIHDRGWQLHLTADRVLTIAAPDKTSIIQSASSRDQRDRIESSHAGETAL
mgnify:CR=1 FL=1